MSARPHGANESPDPSIRGVTGVVPMGRRVGADSGGGMDCDEAELIARWAQGSEDAGRHLVRRHFGAIFGFFDRKVADAADDLAQRTFLIASEARARLDPTRPLRPFLFGVARKLLLQHYAVRHRAGRIEDIQERSLDALDPTPSKLVAKQDERTSLLDALRTLPIDLQITLELHYWEEMPLADIARTFEIPEGTVKSRLHRAKALLRSELARHGAVRSLASTALDVFDRWAASMRGRATQ